MRAFDLKGRAASASEGEYVLGAKDTGSHACYMIYGLLRPGEEGRSVKPGRGHEELVLSVKGDIKVRGARNGIMKEGSAFHITGEDECFLSNASEDEAVYIIAGGHQGGGHH